MTDKVSVEEMEAELEFRAKDAKTNAGRGLYLAILAHLRASQSAEREALDAGLLEFARHDRRGGDPALYRAAKARIFPLARAHGRALLGGRDDLS